MFMPEKAAFVQGAGEIFGLTQGRQTIRVRVKFTPVSTPLFPGYPLPELAWSEMRYTAYSFVMPKFRLKGSQQ